MPTLPRIPVLRLGVVAFAAFAAVGLSPSRAAAECGDYVHILKPGEPPGAPVPQPHRGGPGNPCHGPNCSGKPDTPAPLTAPVVSTSDSKEWAARATGDPDGDSESQGLLPPRSEGFPVQVARPIFHPPRA